MERRPATVAEAMTEWLDDLTLSKSPGTVATYRSLLKLPDCQLLDFDRAFCRAWLMTQLRQRKPSGGEDLQGRAVVVLFLARGAGLRARESVRRPGGASACLRARHGRSARRRWQSCGRRRRS